jgi:probable HAF family extracellular repeat protein
MWGLGNVKLSRRVLLPVAVVAVVAPLTAVAVKESAVASATRQSQPALNLLGGRQTTPSTDVALGFLFERGRYTLFDLPGTGEKSGLIGLNERGEAVGKYLDGGGVYHGLLRDRRGRYTNIDVPKAMGTYALKINDAGSVVGTFNTTSRTVTAPGAQGFLMERGRFTTIAPPRSTFAQAYGINNHRQVVGEYVDAAGTYHGFLWEHGRYTTIDVPKSVATSLVDINDDGQMVGVYITADSPVAHGFLLSSGHFTTFDAPGVPITLVTDVNNRGQIVGTAITNPADSTTYHGFLLADGPRGTFTRIQPPAAMSSFVGGLNDQGQIVGTSNNPNAGSRMPAPMGLMPAGA